MVDLTKAPFNLNEAQMKWVQDTKNNMSLEEKIGQLFFLMSADPNEDVVVSSVTSINAGGIMYRPMKAEEVANLNTKVQNAAKIPLFVAANLEEGANGLVTEGTYIGHEMLVAATDDVENAYKMGEVCMKESKIVGGNMAFAPLVDINFNWENPIANIRCFGDDVDRVTAMSKAYVQGAQNSGGAVTIKHFPGDGVDGRDHHVVKSVNSLAWEDWKKTFGKVYQECIDDGATGMMIGHIALPSFYKEFYPEMDEMQPASLSYELVGDLVRTKLGFNGLMMTDATLMTGFCAEMPRKDAVPRSIATGIDMFLFTKNTEEDYGYMLDGYKEGIITDERLDDAITRILGLKATLGLHENKFEVGDMSLVGSHNDVAKEIVDKAITLVKNSEGVLPLNKDKVKRIGFISLGNESSMEIEFIKLMGLGEDALNYATSNLPHNKFKALLENEGFEVEVLDFSNLMEAMTFNATPISVMKEKYDLFMYFIKKETKSNQTNLRVEFKSMAGIDAPWFVKEVPTMAVSFGNPYHGYDLPMINTFINAYTPSDNALQLTIEKMMGRSEFTGKSPVKLEFEPFTGDISKWSK